MPRNIFSSEEKKKRHAACTKRWREKNPGWGRNELLKYRFGITSEDYDVMYDKQGGACFICGDVLGRGGKGGLHVDHCHNTKVVRALLCLGCNTMLGNAKHSPSILMRGALYLESHLEEVDA